MPFSSSDESSESENTSEISRSESEFSHKPGIPGSELISASDSSGAAGNAGGFRLGEAPSAAAGAAPRAATENPSGCAPSTEAPGGCTPATEASGGCTPSIETPGGCAQAAAPGFRSCAGRGWAGSAGCAGRAGGAGGAEGRRGANTVRRCGDRGAESSTRRRSAGPVAEEGRRCPRRGGSLLLR